MGDEPLAGLWPFSHQLHEAAFPWSRRRLHQQVHQVVEIHAAGGQGLAYQK